MTDNVSSFLNYLESTNNTLLKRFASKYDDFVSEFIIKLNTKPISITSDEWDKIFDEYLVDGDIATAIILSPYPPDAMKDVVLDNFIDGKIKSTHMNFNTEFVANVLSNYTNISKAYCYNLFEQHYRASIHPLTPKMIALNELKNLSDLPYPSSVIEELLKFTVDKFCDFSHPVHLINTSVFSLIPNNETLNYILDKLPTDITTLSPFNNKRLEKIMSAIISAPFLSNKQRDYLFDRYMYCCDFSSLKNATPYISNIVYDNTVEGLFEFKTNTTFLEKRLLNLLANEILSESQQLDLTNRIIEETKAHNDIKQNLLLNTITTITTSPVVLHEIFTRAKSYKNREYAIENKHISKEDLKQQAHLYCQKFQKKIETNTNLPLKWIETIEEIVRKTELNLEDYQHILNTHNNNLYDALVTSPYTPENVLNSLIINIDKMEKSNTYLKTTKIKGLLNKTFMLDKNRSTMLETSITLFNSAICTFVQKEPLYCPLENTEITPNQFEEVKNAIVESVKNSDWLFTGSTKEDFLLFFPEFYKNAFMVQFPTLIKDVKEAPVDILSNFRNRNRLKLLDLLHQNIPQAYLKLSDFAENHCKLENAIKEKSIDEASLEK